VDLVVDLLFALSASARLLVAALPTLPPFGGVPWEHCAHYAVVVDDEQRSFSSFPDRLRVAVLALHEGCAKEVAFEAQPCVARVHVWMPAFDIPGQRVPFSIQGDRSRVHLSSVS
jgi:hypothetical protein